VSRTRKSFRERSSPTRRGGGDAWRPSSAAEQQNPILPGIDILQSERERERERGEGGGGGGRGRLVPTPWRGRLPCYFCLAPFIRHFIGDERRTKECAARNGNAKVRSRIPLLARDDHANMPYRFHPPGSGR